MSKFNKAFGNCQGPLDFPMRDNDAKALEAKLDTGEFERIRIQKAGFEYFIEGEHADVSIINDGSLDKDGEVVDPDSLNFEKYQKNPTVSYNHNYEIPPVGKSIWQKKVNGCWKAKTVYTDKPNDYPNDQVWFPDSIFHMIKSGTMRGKSVGGAASWREPTQEDADRLGFKLDKAKRITKSVDIWEYSVCPIGVNGNTVVELVSKGLEVPSWFAEEFPEIKQYINANKEKIVEIPIIKSFTTIQDFKSAHEALKNQKVKELQEQIPQIVENTFKRLLGQVC